MLRALARVNLAAVERNVARLRRELTDGTQLAAVVKADGYGHGAVPCARAALAGGATWLAVATAQEAAELRAAGIDSRLLVMGALSAEEVSVAVVADADVVTWDAGFVDALSDVAARASRTVRVHVKLDTGMGRLGTRDPAVADAVAERVAEAPELELAGAMTHFATADDRGDDFFAEQVARFEPWAAALKARHPGIVVHAANSPATLREPRAHFDLVRCGVAVYGMDPYGEDPAARELEPALALESYLAELKPCAPGESAGYGRRFVADHDTQLGVLPIGYGDGVRRALSNNAEVLIGAERVPVVGTVSMDNLTVDLGPAPSAAPGAPAVLLGAQGAERITAEEIARRLQSINYEVTCGIAARVPRQFHRDGAPA